MEIRHTEVAAPTKINRANWSSDHVVTDLNLTYANVKDYGALGDGLTDDTAAIEAACAAVGYGTLFFPKGDYLIGNLVIPDTSFVGESMKSTYFSTYATSGIAMAFTEGTSLNMLRRISDFRLVTNGGTESVLTGIEISQTDSTTGYWRVEGVGVSGLLNDDVVGCRILQMNDFVFTQTMFDAKGVGMVITTDHSDSSSNAVGMGVFNGCMFRGGTCGLAMTPGYDTHSTIDTLVFNACYIGTALNSNAGACERIAQIPDNAGGVQNITHVGCHYEMSGSEDGAAYIEIYGGDPSHPHEISWTNCIFAHNPTAGQGWCDALLRCTDREAGTWRLYNVRFDGVNCSGTAAHTLSLVEIGDSSLYFSGCSLSHFIGYYTQLCDIEGALWEDGQGGWELNAVPGYNYYHDMQGALKIMGNRHTAAAAAPASGTWAVGDIVFNSVPSTGQPIGWMCTNATGSGTWKSMGALA